MKDILAKAAFILLLLSLAIPAFVQGTEAQTLLRISYIPILAAEPLYVAADKGFFTKYNLKSKFNPFRGGAAQVEALLGGSVDVLGLVSFEVPMFLASRTGIYLKLAHPQNWVGTYKGKKYGPQSFVAVRADLTVKTMSELKGKAIAVPILREVNYIGLRVGLEKAGLDPDKDVQVMEIPFPKMGPALAAGLYKLNQLRAGGI